MTSLRKLSQNDYIEWIKIYEIYADHYQVILTDKSRKKTWEWLMDYNHPLNGLGVMNNSKLVGVAHYRSMPSPLRGENIGFLDDLIVDPKFRGLGIAEMLIKEVKIFGKKNGWKIIRWITRDNNYRARAVYDKLSKKTDWNVYEMGCD